MAEVVVLAREVPEGETHYVGTFKDVTDAMKWIAEQDDLMNYYIAASMSIGY